MDSSTQQAPPGRTVMCQVRGQFEDGDLGRILRGLPQEASGLRLEDGIEIRFAVSAPDTTAATEVAVRIVHMALSWAGLERAAAGVSVEIA